MTDRDLLLKFIASLTLCDHMGDVSNDVEDVLKRMDLRIEWDDWDELRAALAKMGVTTLMDTQLTSEDES